MSSKRKKRVLAIDDEPSMTEWLRILLEHAGYEVKTALIGTRGEEIFKTWQPDAVVIDMLLPDGEVHLRSGDVLVQQATDHAWENRSDKVARAAFFHIDARFSEELLAKLPRPLELMR